MCSSVEEVAQRIEPKNKMRTSIRRRRLAFFPPSDIPKLLTTKQSNLMYSKNSLLSSMIKNQLVRKYLTYNALFVTDCPSIIREEG
jgi:hypothetical protein